MPGQARPLDAHRIHAGAQRAPQGDPQLLPPSSSPPSFAPRLDAEFEEMGGPVFREVVGRMGEDGWLGIGWPKEYGGKGFTALEQFIFWDETYRARAPLPVISVNTIGPTIMQFGTEEQKAELLPKIIKGQVFFGVGYTEPSAGTDLASLVTRAVREGDEYVINGQKLFTTHAHDADYIWLAARTDPDAPKHKGPSRSSWCPTDTPGFSCTPDLHPRARAHQRDLLRERARARFANLVGTRERRVGHLITSQLNHERITLAAPGVVRSPAGRSVAVGGGHTVAGRRPHDRRRLGADQSRPGLREARSLKVLNWRSAWSINYGVPDMAEASASRSSAPSSSSRPTACCSRSSEPPASSRRASPGAIFGGLLENSYRTAGTYTFGGGVNEVQRDIIAAAGLGLPRGRR